MARPDFPSRLDELALLVHQIPRGRCAAYGDVGRALRNPVSGYLAGKWMAMLGDRHGEVPWWRVVKKDGAIAIFDRSPEYGILQRRRLEQEGTPFVGDRVDMAKAGWNEFELGPAE